MKTNSKPEDYQIALPQPFRALTRFGWCLALAGFVVWTAGCGGDASVGLKVPPPTPLPGPGISGTVLLPSQSQAAARPSLLERLAALAVRSALALTGNVRPVGRNVIVTLTQLEGPDGSAGPTITSTSTNDAGQYFLSLPSGSSEDTCRFMVREQTGGTRALVYSSSEAINIDFNSDAAVTLILNTARNNGKDFCLYSANDIRNIVQAIRQAPGVVTGTTAAEVNSEAAVLAAMDPTVQAALLAPLELLGSPTPTTQATATDTPVPSPTFTRTRTNTPRNTPTRTPSAKPTSTRTGTATATRTATTAFTATQTPTNTPPNTPTRTPTSTSSATATVTQPPPSTATQTPTETPTSPPPTFTFTSTASPTSPPLPSETPTMQAASPTPTSVGGPQITIGSATGAPGNEVAVTISLAKNGPDIVTIAPLVFDFDAGVLSFSACTSEVIGKSIDAVSPSEGRVSLVLQGGLEAIPDGPIVSCTLPINAAATAGASALTFVRAGMSDADSNEFVAAGTNGTVSVVTAQPVITIGTATEHPGMDATVTISLVKNVPNIVTIAPLVFDFDPAVLSFSSCASQVNGKSVDAVSPSTGQVSLVLQGGLSVIPDGAIVTCTLAINAAATNGSILPFVHAGTADLDLNDITAAGSDGLVGLQ